MHEVWVVIRKVSVIVIGIFVGKLQVLLSIGVVGMLLVHTVLAQPFQTTMLSRLEILLLTCCFLTLWIGGIFVVYPQCRSEESSAHYICLVGEAVVLAMNILCSFVGLGTYIWLAWMEQREKITGRGKKVCAQLSTWKVFQPCCKKGFGQWLRESQVEWLDNPLGAANVDIEMTRPENVLEGVARSVLESKLKQCQMENKVLKEKNEDLQKRLKYFEKGSSSMRKKNSNSWKIRRNKS